jgi:hypothetical protein
MRDMPVLSFVRPSGPSASHLLFGRGTFPVMATGAQFEPVRVWPRLMSASFDAPAVAPSPVAAGRPVRPAVEGKWARVRGATTTDLTIEAGRIRATWHAEADGRRPEIRFSGTCSMADGQVFGVIDSLEFDSGSTDEAHAAAARLIDQPFAARIVADGDSLIIKDVRCAGLEPNVEEETSDEGIADIVRFYVCGQYLRHVSR